MKMTAKQILDEIVTKHTDEALVTDTDAVMEEMAARIADDNTDAQCFRWLLEHHGGIGKAIAGVGMRCWIGGVEFYGEDVRDAILANIVKKKSLHT